MTSIAFEEDGFSLSNELLALQGLPLEGVKRTAGEYFAAKALPCDAGSPVSLEVARLAGGDLKGFKRNSTREDLSLICGEGLWAGLVKRCVASRVKLPEGGGCGAEVVGAVHKRVNALVSQLVAAGVVGAATEWQTARFALGERFFADLGAIARAPPSVRRKRFHLADGSSPAGCCVVLPSVVRAWDPSRGAWAVPDCFLALPRRGLGVQREAVLDAGSLPLAAKLALRAGEAWLEEWKAGANGLDANFAELRGGAVPAAWLDTRGAAVPVLED